MKCPASAIDACPSPNGLGPGLSLPGAIRPIATAERIVAWDVLRGTAALFGIAVFAVQLFVSAWWLRRFCFGSAEWLWRSAAYGRWQRLAVRSTLVLCVLILGLRQAEAQTAECREVNQTVREQVGNGQLTKAELALSAALENRPEPLCTGVILTNLGAIREMQGKYAEAETLARRALGLLEEHYAQDSIVLLRPLQILASSRFEQGKLTKAKEAFERMLLLPLGRPEDAALVHGMAASLLESEGKLSEAEAEYLAAIRAWDGSGYGETADVGSVLQALAALYLHQERLADASQLLKRAREVFLRAKDTVPMDRIKFLNMEAVLHFRQGQWLEAEQDLREAVSMADQESRIEPSTHAALLAAYARVLRKNHHAGEARRVETWLAALRRSAAIRDVVDVSELVPKPKPTKK